MRRTIVVQCLAATLALVASMTLAQAAPRDLSEQEMSAIRGGALFQNCGTAAVCGHCRHITGGSVGCTGPGITICGGSSVWPCSNNLKTNCTGCSSYLTALCTGDPNGSYSVYENRCK